MRLTSQGWSLVALALLVAMAAANTGANLLFLILGLMLGLLLHALIAGGLVFRGLQVSAQLGALVEAGGSSPGRLRVSAAHPGTFVLSARDWLPAGGLLAEPQGPGEGSVELGFPARAPGRGVWSELELSVVSRAPLHLLERRKALRLPIDVHVHPRLLAPETVEGAGRIGNDRPARHAGEGGGLRDLREYAPGDNPRHVHWRLSARRGEPIVRRFHGQAREEVEIHVELLARAGPEFEALLERAASRSRDALRQGLAVILVLGQERIRMESPRDLARGLFRLARAAPLPPGAGGGSPAALARVSRRGRRVQRLSAQAPAGSRAGAGA